MNFSIFWILLGCSEDAPQKQSDTSISPKDTGLGCEEQESQAVTSIYPHIAGTLTSACSYERGVVSPEGNSVAIRSMYCSETEDAEGNLFVYSYPEMELKFETQGSYPQEFLGDAYVGLGQIENVGTGPLVAFSWLERNAYPGPPYGGVDLYDVNTSTLLTRIHSMRSWPGGHGTFLENFWVLEDVNAEQNGSQIQVYDMHNMQSEINSSDAIAIHHSSNNMPLSEPYAVGDADGDGLKDLIVTEAAGYWFLSQEDAVYDNGIINAIYLPVRNTEFFTAPTSTPDWNGDGLEDIAMIDTSHTNLGDVLIVSPISYWPLATYITSDQAREVLGNHLERVEGFEGKGEEGLLVDKAQDYVGPTSYFFLAPGGCGTLSIEEVGSPLIQDELPMGYSTIWGQGQLLMFFPEIENDNTEHPIYLLTPMKE